MGSVDFTTDHVQNSEAVIARKRSLIEVWSAHQKKKCTTKTSLWSLIQSDFCKCVCSCVWKSLKQKKLNDKMNKRERKVLSFDHKLIICAAWM